MNLDEVLRDLLAERYGPTDRMRRRVDDDPHVFERRRAILDDALTGNGSTPSPANVVPLRRAA
jgi:hypothetical protein